MGAARQPPPAARHLYGGGYLTDLLAVRMGGRAAELVVFGHGSTGAANDLAGATELATKMVTEFGLSPELGPVGYPQAEQRFLPGPVADLAGRRFSEQTQRVVDREVARLLREAEEHAVCLLREHRTALDRLATELMDHETVDGAAVLEALEHEAKALAS